MKQCCCLVLKLSHVSLPNKTLSPCSQLINTDDGGLSKVMWTDDRGDIRLFMRPFVELSMSCLHIFGTLEVKR